MRWLRRLVLAGLLMSVLSAAGLGLYARRALPLAEGELRVDGLLSEVRVERDDHGIPTIRAASIEDASFGLGFVHAQDRLWQMEMQRRVGAGRLAEVLGSSALNTDIFLRTLQVRRAAQAQFDALRGEPRALLLAYTAGINAALQRGVRALPPEYWMLGVAPEPWDPVDSVAWSIMMAWDLGGNWQNELLRLRLSMVLPMHRVQELLPAYPGEPSRLPSDYAERLRSWQVAGDLTPTLDRLLSFAPSGEPEGLGSNNWAVAGSASTTGAPLLANDPHLRLTAPSLWYLARLQTPGLQVAGATLPGMPTVLLGQNGRLAWGFTNTGPDVQDLYLERLDPNAPDRYQTPEGWSTMQTVVERIRVRGGEDQTIKVRRTRHGPVLSDIGIVSAGLPMFAGKAPAHALSLRWTALDPDPGTMQAAVALQRARSVDEYLEAVRPHVAPMQNMLVADRRGRIAFVAAGRVPRRGPGHDLWGMVPAPGWLARYDWQGFLDAGATPRELDPARGWLATANQRVHGPDFPHFLTADWTPPFRQQRIEQLLASRPRHDLDSFAAMQADTRSLAAVALLPVLQRTAGAHPMLGLARQVLDGFEGDMKADGGAPLLYWAWQRHLAEAVFADEVGVGLWTAALSGRTHQEALQAVMSRENDWWCDDKTTPQAIEPCMQRSELALGRALDELVARLGRDPAHWQWGAVHQARSEHRPFSRVSWLAPWFELRSPAGGDAYTLNAARASLRAADPAELYLNNHGPSLRALYDVGDPSRSRVIQSTGQSGIFFSRHYRDFAGRWSKGDTVPLWAPLAVDGARTLQLRPDR